MGKGKKKFQKVMDFSDEFFDEKGASAPTEEEIKSEVRNDVSANLAEGLGKIDLKNLVVLTEEEKMKEIETHRVETGSDAKSDSSVSTARTSKTAKESSSSVSSSSSVPPAQELKPVKLGLLKQFGDMKEDLVAMIRKTYSEDEVKLKEMEKKMVTLKEERKVAQAGGKATKEKYIKLNEEVVKLGGDMNPLKSRNTLYTVLLAHAEKWNCEGDFVQDFFLEGGFVQVVDTAKKLEAHIKEIQNNIENIVTSCLSQLRQMNEEQVIMKNKLREMAKILEDVKPKLTNDPALRALIIYAKYYDKEQKALVSLPDKVAERILDFATSDEILSCFPVGSVTETSREDLGVALQHLVSVCTKRRKELLKGT